MYLGMFAYPWDAALDGFLERYAELGCNMIAINAVYHQCNVLDTRLSRIYERGSAGASFALHPEKYGRMKPQMVTDFSKTFGKLREDCDRHGIDWRCWTVNLHNSQLGSAYPDTAVENVWGDRYTSALCVNHPDVQEYANAVLTDVIETLTPSRVIMEAECWLHAFHGRHHEFALARLTHAIRYLLSLCFCPHCMKAAQEAGVDATLVRERTRMLLKNLIEADTTFGSSEDSQLMQILLEYPELYAYQQFRMQSVKALVRQTADTAHQKGVLYEYIPSSAPFPINNMHFDGSSFRELADVVDGFMPLCYTQEETWPFLRRNVALFAPEARVSLALCLRRADYASAGALIAKITEAAEEGVQDIYCYNYGLATEECLGWMRKAYHLAKEKEG